MNADSPDLPALIAKAREPYLWAYPTVQGLVAALEAAAKENERLSVIRPAIIEAETEPFKAAARELLDLLDQGGTVEAFGAAKLKLGALVEWTPAPRISELGPDDAEFGMSDHAKPGICGND